MNTTDFTVKKSTVIATNPTNVGTEIWTRDESGRETSYLVNDDSFRARAGHEITAVLYDRHPREIFRAAIVRNAAAICVIHNHPSGSATASSADISVTRDLIRAGQLLKIEVVDHIVMGLRTVENPKDFSSLRELGYFYS